jgi:hypothetical protein
MPPVEQPPRFGAAKRLHNGLDSGVVLGGRVLGESSQESDSIPDVQATNDVLGVNQFSKDFWQ